MYGLNKRFVSIAVGIVLLVSLSGCIQEDPAEPDQAPKESILSPVTIPYLIRNPIEEHYTEETEDGWVKRRVTISGLADQVLETAINDHLTEIYHEMSGGELPPYRGIRQVVPEGITPSSISLDASLSFNYNNVLSVMVYSNLSLEQTGKSPVYVGWTESVNIDLNTGEEILLKDVFADDVDYQTLLSECVYKRLMKSNPMEEEESFLDMMTGGLRLVAPFKGIEEDQKFALYQGGLVLIIDYENPEFNTGFYANTIYIPFEEMGPVIAVTERFTDPKRNLYQSEKPLVYEFVQTGSLEREQKQELVETHGIQIYKTLNHPKELPEAAMKKIRELQEIDEQMILQFKKTASAQDEGVPGMEHNVWAVKAGRYTNVSRNLSFFSMKYAYGSREDYCYDEKGDPVVLEDLFVEGFQWENLVVSAIEKAISQEPALRGENPDKWMQDLQFSLGLSEIHFTTAPIQRGDNNEYPLYFSISYEEIGCSSLKLFKSL